MRQLQFIALRTSTSLRHTSLAASSADANNDEREEHLLYSSEVERLIVGEAIGRVSKTVQAGALRNSCCSYKRYKTSVSCYSLVKLVWLLFGPFC